MAYQTRERDPLLDSNMALAIEKRSKELIGLALLVLGLMAAAMIYSYSPEDPSWISATDAGVQNWVGRFGASVAAPITMIVGKGAWGIAILLLVWGARFVAHYGQERAITRLIFAPIWIAVLSLYASSLVPNAQWLEAFSFGLGGLFGDMGLGMVLGLLPVNEIFGLKLLSLIMAVMVLGLGAYVLGCTMAELRRFGRFLFLGVVTTYAIILKLLGKGGVGALSAARSMQTRHAEARAVKHQEQQAYAAEQAAVAQVTSHQAAEPQLRAEPVLQAAAIPAAPAEEAQVSETQILSATRIQAPATEPEPIVKPGILARLRRRKEELNPEPGMVDPATLDPEDRIRMKISNVIRTRSDNGEVVEPIPDEDLTLGGTRSPDPLILNDTAEVIEEAASELPPEPPLTAAAPIQQNFTYEKSEAVAIQIPTPEQKSVVQRTPPKTPTPSQQAKAEAQPKLQFEERAKIDYELPPLSLLTNPVSIQRHHLSDEALEENARMLEAVLDDYGVKGEIVSVRPGPVVTMYELEPAPGLKASRVIGLSDDIARSMSALSARVSTVPGRSVIGIELPNENREKVVLREILSTRDFGDGTQKLPLALGKDIGGDAVVANLAKMPHLLIAGTTGSGKSVAINTMILSLLYKLTPEECRLIMIDPKMLELSVYDGIPHLLSPVVTDPKKAVVALKWVVSEMEDRYRKMSKMGVRNIDGYNSRVKDALDKNEMFSRTVQTGFDDNTGEPVFETEEFAPEKMPYIVVIVDEMADLMMVAGKEIEACIQRLAQMARASGIHLIMATQRPSVDVITGTIKANFPTRISFQVTSKVDSRTILGEMGAEQLLGMGDMLYMAGGGKITRCHGPFVSDEEVEEIVNHLKAFGPPEYVGGVVEGPEDDKAGSIDAVLGLGGNTDGEDALYDQAVQIAIRDRKASTSYIQRKLAIGYNKAARLVEQMEDNGVISAANHVGKRDVLVPEQAH